MVVSSHFSSATTNSKAPPNVLALGDPNCSVCIWEILITVSALPNTLEESLGPNGDIEVKSFCCHEPSQGVKEELLTWHWFFPPF